LFISKTTLTFIEVEFISFASNNKNIHQAIYTMKDLEFVSNSLETPRHKTAYLSAGPSSALIMIFIHGWPELNLVWRSQMEFFAVRGWRCIAPDMRGYGGSSVPRQTGSYAISEIVTDMIELHDALLVGSVW
jgi:pimeloyl-ACP methyl ester carboxylesterase